MFSELNRYTQPWGYQWGVPVDEPWKLELDEISHAGNIRISKIVEEIRKQEESLREGEKVNNVIPPFVSSATKLITDRDYLYGQIRPDSCLLTGRRPRHREVKPQYEGHFKQLTEWKVVGKVSHMDKLLFSCTYFAIPKPRETLC